MVVTPDEMEALTSPGEDEDGEEADDGEDDRRAGHRRVNAMSDEEFAALEAEFEAESGDGGQSGFTPNYQPEGEPVGASLSAEAQFAIDLAVARQEETARELAVVTARLREEDYQAEKRKLADLGVPPYITELARPLLEGAGHAVELANGKTVDAGAIMRRVLSEYARQARLLDLGVELGSAMDEPEDAGNARRRPSVPRRRGVPLQGHDGPEVTRYVVSAPVTVAGSGYTSPGGYWPPRAGARADLSASQRHRLRKSARRDQPRTCMTSPARPHRRQQRRLRR